MNSVAITAATILMVAFILFKVPVFVSVLISSITYFVISDTSIFYAAQRITSGIESVSLLACPFFIMAGVLFNYTGVTDRLVDFCSLVTGRMSGGLAQANILLSTIMGGMSGSSVADAAMEAKILVPPMEKSGLSKPFSAVITAFSSTITPLIPPGIGMILYGTLSGASVGSLFMWGLGIGSIMCVLMILFTEIIANKRGYKPYLSKRASGKEIALSIKRSWPALMLPVVIIGSIRVGIISPSEAGAVAVAYSFVLGLVWRQWNWKKFKDAMRESAVATGALMLIIGTAAVYSWILTKEQIPQKLAMLMLNYISNRFVFMLTVNIFLLFVGMLMEGASATIILAPLLAPVALKYGINLVHFGMVMVYNMSIGGLTPPVGTLMFVTCGVTKCKLKDFLTEAMPYYIFMIILLTAITYVPFSFGFLYG